MKKPLPNPLLKEPFPSPSLKGREMGPCFRSSLKEKGESLSSTLLSPHHLVDYSYIALDDLDNLS